MACTCTGSEAIRKPKWQRTKLAEAGENHGGNLPKGIGDINGDGFLDIVYIDRWFENVGGEASQWIVHKNIPFGRAGHGALRCGHGWRTWTRTAAWTSSKANAMSPWARMAWFRNVNGDGTQWVKHLLPGRTDPGDYHSLAVADFDKDGDFDVYADEMEHSRTSRAVKVSSACTSGKTWTARAASG